jgi:staphylococcal nuclease domain-containing protein 1
MTLLGIANLEKLMVEFAKHYQNAPSPPGYVPKANELISAKFSDGQWYRAKVRRTSPAKREAEVTFIDYGESQNTRDGEGVETNIIDR